MPVQLYPHQVKALEETKDFNRVAYYLDMGLGKTFVGSEKMIQLGSTINLLVCQKSKVQDWVEHLNKYYGYPGHIKSDCYPYQVMDLTKEKAKWFSTNENFITKPLVVGHRIYVINYELAFRRPELLKLEHFTLMLDESSMITNPTAKRTEFIHKLNPDNVVLLSGTPTGGKYEKLWSQLHLLGWSISKKLFLNQYTVTEKIDDGSGFKRNVIVDYKNVDRLKLKLKQHGCIFMKTDEVFDLPEQVQIPVEVTNTKEFRYFMRNDLVTLSDGTELIGDTKLTKRMYARQLCGQYSKAKLSAFQDLIESTDDRLIVFYNFNEELAKMKSIVESLEKPVSIVNGSIKDLDAYEIESDSVTFVQYQAGAMGLNLQKSNKIIYFTLPQSSELFEQSMKRIHRIGQKNNCFYYLLMVKNSVEQQILETLKQRKNYDDALFIKYEGEFQ